MPEPQAEATAAAPASSPLLTRLTVSDKSGGKCSLYRSHREGGRERGEQSIRSARMEKKESTTVDQHTVDGTLQ